ncbi:MAG: glycoside hydrolase family 99-like domain-containing protein [Candidatus Dadabacteria bacterium]
MKLLIYILLSIFLLSACVKKNKEYLPPNFNYAIPAVTLTENVNVGAYYYNYSATDWSKKYTNTPTLGQYSALTASVMAQQRQWADQGGVDFFIFNWNGTSTGDPQLTSFVNGRNERVKMVINYNTAHLSVSNTSPLIGTKLTTMINELKALAATHFSQEYYYKTGDQPVILITPLNLATSAAASIDYTTVIPAVKQALSAAGFNLYIIGEITTGWLPPLRYATATKVMDGVTANNWSTDVYDRAVFFASYSDMNWKNWTDSTTAWNMDFTPSIFPGYNDKVMSPTSKMYDLGGTPAFYTDYCNVAKRNMGKKRIVLINSWNNFQVGTTIEPTTEYGTSFLDLTKNQFKIK